MKFSAGVIVSGAVVVLGLCNRLGQRVDIAAVVIDLDRPKGPRRHRVAAADQLIVQRAEPAGRIELVARIGLQPARRPQAAGDRSGRKVGSR